MKKIKKIAAIISAAVLCSVPLLSLNANAVDLFGWGYYTPGTEEYDSYMEGFVEFDDSGVFKEWPGEDKEYRCFSHKPDRDGRDFVGMIRVLSYKGCEFTFTLSDSTESDELNKTVEQVLAEYDDADYRVSYNETLYQWTVADREALPETFDNAKKICSELKDKEIISDFTYYDDIYYGQSGYFDSVYGYPMEYYDEIEEFINGFETDISLRVYEDVNRDAGGNIIYSRQYAQPYRTNGATVDELFEVFKLIEDELGLDHMSHLSILESESSAIATPIDLFNAEESTTEEPATEEPTTEELTTEAEQTSEISTEPATEAPEDEFNEAASEQDKEQSTEISEATEAPTSTEAESTAAASDSAPKTGRSGAGLALAGLATAASVAFALRKKEN